MKQNWKLSVLALSTMVAGVFGACSSDEDVLGLGDKPLVLSPVKAPEVLAYSGNTILGSTFGTRGTDMNANEWNTRWDCPPRPAEDLTDEELAELKYLLSKGVPTENTIVLPFENYYVQQIYKGDAEYYGLDHCETPNNNGSGQPSCNGNNTCEHLTSGDHTTNTKVKGSDQMNKLVAWNGTTYEHINNFNNGTNDSYPSNCGCGKQHYKTTLMTGMPTTGIDANKQFGFHESFATNHDYNNYIIVEYKGYYYVGFDYEGHKYDQNTHNHNEVLDVERDWNFTDWIVRITPAYHKGETPENNPGGIIGEDGSGQEEKCPDCHHPSHDGYCDEPGCDTPACRPNDPPVVDEDTTDVPSVDNHTNEVEVNLHADQKPGDYLESHLSIHVRHAGDVEIFIPIPEQYYCDADDMAIVMQHEPNHMGHGGPFTYTYTLKDSDLEVTLNIEYKTDGIRIWTKGVDQAVIDWCMEKCQDGITFEVWNYFDKDVINLETLKEYLNQATIEFKDNKEPDYYINAFTGDENDCTVGIVDTQRDDYKDAETGKHLNGSDLNEIYKNKNVTETAPEGEGN